MSLNNKIAFGAAFVAVATADCGDFGAAEILTFEDAKTKLYNDGSVAVSWVGGKQFFDTN